MSPGYIALIFWALSALAVWGIRNNIRTGVASSRGWTVQHDENPLGFALILCGKGSVFIFTICETLHAFGIIGDPFVAIGAVLPFQHHAQS